jgi:hypothetical protein
VDKEPKIKVYKFFPALREGVDEFLADVKRASELRVPYAVMPYHELIDNGSELKGRYNIEKRQYDASEKARKSEHDEAVLKELPDINKRIAEYTLKHKADFAIVQRSGAKFVEVAEPANYIPPPPGERLEPHQGSNAVMVAAGGPDPKLLRFMIKKQKEQGGNINDTNLSGETALDFAVTWNRYNKVEKITDLVKAGAKIEDGHIVHLAKEEPETLKALIDTKLIDQKQVDKAVKEANPVQLIIDEIDMSQSKKPGFGVQFAGLDIKPDNSLAVSSVGEAPAGMVVASQPERRLPPKSPPIIAV